MVSFALASFVIGAAVSGIVGNRSDAVLCQVMRDITERLRRGEPAVNHDIQRAVRKAYLQATLAVCEACLQERGVEPWVLRRDLRTIMQQAWRPDEEIRWLDNVRGAIHKELGQLPQAEYELPSTVAVKQVELLLQPKGSPGVQRLAELRTDLRKGLLDEVSHKYTKKYGEPPGRFLEMVQGQDDTTSDEAATRLDWFELLCAFFVHQLKTNERVRSLFEGQLLAQLTVEGVTFEAMEKEFSNLAGKLTQRFDVLDEQLTQLRDGQAQGFEETLDRLDEILPYAALLPDITQQQKAIQEALQAIQRELRRRPLYERYAGWEVAGRVDELIQDYTALFVGREAELGQLDDFLASDTSGIMIITANAGFGKSALLANWVRARQGNGCFIARHFFSHRHDVTRSLTNAYEHLLQQLYEYYEIDAELPPLNRLRDTLIGLLGERGAQKSEPLVIVLDGLDEADQPFSPPFPSQLPEGVFGIASARAEEGETPEYLRGWIEMKDVTRLHLACLPRPAIADWLRRAGDGELAALAGDEKAVQQMEAKTEGLPLYLHHLTEELARAARQGADIRDVLEQTPQGLSRYVAQQLSRLEELDLPEPCWRLFALLAVAKGAFNHTEIKALTGLRDRELRQVRRTWQVTRWLKIPGEQESAFYAFAHPLLATTFAERLGDDAENALQALVEWCSDWKQHRSHYAVHHYAGHLAQAGRWEELHALVATGEERQEWAEAHHAVEGSYAGYIADLHLAWAHADEVGRTGPAAVGWQVRYAFIESSIHSLVGNIPAELLASAVKHGIWLPQAALEYARQIPEVDHRNRALTQLALQSAMSGRLEDAWNMLQAMRGRRTEEQAVVLSALARLFLAEDRLQEATAAARQVQEIEESLGTVALISSAAFADLISHGYSQQALAAVRKAGHESWRASVLVALAPNIPESEIEDTLAIAREIQTVECRGRTLAQLASRAAEVGHLQQARQIAQEIEYPEHCARALVAVASHLSDPERHQTLTDAITTAEGILDKQSKCQTLAVLVRQFSELGYPEEALATIQKIDVAEYRVSALLDIASCLPIAEREQVLTSTLSAAGEIQNPYDQIRTLVALAPQLSETDREQALQQAFTAASDIRDPKAQAKALISLAPVLPEQLLRNALAIVPGNLGWAQHETEVQWAEVLSALVLRLAELGYTQEAVTITRESGSVVAQRLAGMQLAARLAELGQIRESLAAVQSISLVWARAQTLADLASHLPKSEREGILQDAWITAQQEQDAGNRSLTLAKLALRFGELGCPDKAMTAIQAISPGQTRFETLASVASHLPLPYLRQALTLARAIGDDYYREKVIAKLVPDLAKSGYVQEALTAAQKIRDTELSIQALTDLAPFVSRAESPLILQEALATVPKLEYEHQRAQALMRLTRCYAELGLPQEALSIAHQIGSPQDRARILIDIASNLSEQERTRALQEAFRFTHEIEREENRQRMLIELMPHLSQALRVDALQLLLSPPTTSHRQPDRLVGRRQLPLCLAEQGCSKEALAVVQQMENEREQASALIELAPHLPNTARQDALVLAQQISAKSRLPVLLAIVADLPEPDREPVLQDATNMAETLHSQPSDQATLLINLIPYLSGSARESALRDALDTAQGLHSEPTAQAELLISLVPLLIEPERGQLALQALTIAQGLHLEGSAEIDLLTSLIPHLPESVREGTVQSMLERIRKFRSGGELAETLAAVVPYLSGVTREQALQDAMDGIQKETDDRKKASALTALAPYLPEALLQTALEIVPKIGFENIHPDFANKWSTGVEYRVEALTALAPRLPIPLLQQAVQIGQSIKDEYAQEKALKTLATRLVELNCFQEALVAAQHIRREHGAADALKSLASRSVELGHVEQALTAALTIDAASTSRADSFEEITPYLVSWADKDRGAAYAAWVSTLHTLAGCARKSAVSDIQGLSSAVTALGAPDAMVETLHAVQDVGCWWP